MFVFSYFVDHNEILLFTKFSVQIALDCILVYSNFQNFPGEHAPRTPLNEQGFLEREIN